MTQKVTVNLAIPTLNRGTAVAGDSYAGIENITGTIYKDSLTGDGAANVLSGGKAGDLLVGVGGNDTLVGGVGADTLAGGTDANVFLFEIYGERGDIVQDFATGEDLLMINAAAYGIGIATGALNANAFVSGTTHHALYASDRFIFDTTDPTLWVDRDGTGKVATVLMADFADGTVFVASDILLA